MPQDFTTGQVLTAAQMDTLSGAVDGYATTATAAGTTTLTTASMYQQFFTGVTTQTVTMPVASTLYTGQKFRIVNNSSGVVTVQSSGANTIYAIPAGGDVIFTCILASGTSAASWDYKNATAAGGSKVLQVVYAGTTTRVINATNTVADTTLTATITPTLATSKILVLYSQNGLRKTDVNTGNSIVLTLLRGASVIATGAIQLGYTGTAIQNFPGGSSLCFSDSPATTSATTYKTQFRNDVNFSSVEVQSNSDLSTMILMEIGA